MRFLPANFNDTLAVMLIIIIPALWILYGKGIMELSESVNGGLLVTWSLIVQYYFRKAKTEK